MPLLGIKPCLANHCYLVVATLLYSPQTLLKLHEGGDKNCLQNFGGEICEKVATWETEEMQLGPSKIMTTI